MLRPDGKKILPQGLSPRTLSVHLPSTQETDQVQGRASTAPTVTAPMDDSERGGFQSDVSASVEDRAEPCLFYAHTCGCAKGELCEYSHDRIEVADVSSGKMRQAVRGRIRQRVMELLVVEDLYQVHHALQEEASKSPFAMNLIKTHLEASRRLPQEAGATKVVFSL